MTENNKELNDIFLQDYMHFIPFGKSKQAIQTYTYILISQCTNKNDDTFEDDTNECEYYLVDTRDDSVYCIDLNINNINNIAKKKNEENEYEIVAKEKNILNFEVIYLVEKINSGDKYKNKMRTIFDNYI